MSSIKSDTFRSYLIIFIGTHPSRFERFAEVQEPDPLRSNVCLPCAYHRTAAVLTCLHIPMQPNIAYFSFPVLAPLLPASPLPPARLWTPINATPGRGLRRTPANRISPVKHIFQRQIYALFPKLPRNLAKKCGGKVLKPLKNMPQIRGRPF